jgi:hypothetical protein
MRERVPGESDMVAGFMVLLLLGGVFGLIWLLMRLAGWLSAGSGKVRLPRRMSEPVSPKVTAVFWTIFLGGVAVTLYLGSSPGARPPVPEAPSGWTWVSRLALLFAIASTLSPVVIRWFRRRDELVVAMKRADAGDAEGAIRDLRQAINTRGSSPDRSHALARLLMRKENWIDARKLLLEAEDLSSDRLRYRGDMAVILRNLGRPEDALALLEPVVNHKGARIEDLCTSCDLFMDLDQLEAARDRIVQAEAAFKKLATTSPYEARHRRPMIDVCRERLERKLTSKKPLELDEL